jgi:hypothetical protein
VGTPLEGVEATREIVSRTDEDWLQTSSDGKGFDGAGGSRNLGDLFTAFARFAGRS